MHGNAGHVTRTILPLLPNPKNKNCEIFYTKFKFYMGRDSDSMNISIRVCVQPENIHIYVC